MEIVAVDSSPETKNEERFSRRPMILMVLFIAVVLVSFLYIWLVEGVPLRLWLTRGRMNVLVVTIDTCRADHVGCYGYGKARTPVIDSIAASGVRFARAYSVAPVTLPSHCTIFTGMYPAGHGVLDNGLFKLPMSINTMAESFQNDGAATAAVISAFVLHRQYGLDQGFDHYDDYLSDDKTENAMYDEMRASEVSDRAVKIINRLADKRFFIWLHYFDPHAGYVPPRKFEDMFDNPYDGEIAYVDEQLGRVIAALEERGIRENTLIIITSDHGESLGEHGESTHAMFLYNATQRVPLIMSLPGVIRSGLVLDAPVSLLDLMPTVLDIAFIEIPETVQGKSLMALIFPGLRESTTSPLIMETHSPWYQYGWSPSFALVDENYKYIEAPRPELYKLDADPRELDNIYPRNKGRAEVMRKRLDTIREGYLVDSSYAETSSMDDEARKRLLSLGYVFDRSGPAGNVESAPDVKDMIDTMRMMDEATALRNAGHLEQAISIMENIVERNRNDRRTLNRLGLTYARAGMTEKAEKAYKRVIELDPGFMDAYVNLGNLYVKNKEFDKAIEIARFVTDNDPENPYGHNLMGYARYMKGDLRAAVDPFERAIELYPTFLEAHVNLGSVYGNLGNYRRAYDHFRIASKIDPDNKFYAELAEKARSAMERSNHQ